jgi:hypothetical protein
MTRTISQIRDELVDREAIRDCLARYCRGVDRFDADMLRSVYWPEAIDDHGIFEGTVEEFIAWSEPQLRAAGQFVHMIGNSLIRIEGSTAKVETYFWAVLTNPGGSGRDLLHAGRYMDQFERRGDEWRIAARLVAIDWYQEQAGTADWSQGPFGRPDMTTGRLAPDDQSYGWLGLDEK